MKQLTQQLRNGELRVQEVPTPALRHGAILVRNHFSLISAGTEGSTVKTARKSLLGKAKERPQQVKQVLDVLKRQGPLQTYRAVMKKLDAYSPLGYSSAGTVVALGDGVSGFTEGDKVACAGVGYANHAEFVAVPQLLCVKLNRDANLKHASFNTIGAIAMQGVRQADLRVGETCVVIGLGLIGQVVSRVLRASGVQTIGVDIDSTAVARARDNSCDHAWQRNENSLVDEIEQLTGGLGADAVIIAAGTSSTDPINFAGEVCRKKGRIVIVGAVPTGFDRDPHYYRKELEVRMSCSYGPGRYDPSYEEHGIDYPAAHVRWTQNRNMEAFQRLIHSGSVNVDELATHEFKIDDASDAYELVVSNREYHLGIVLKYDPSGTTSHFREPARQTQSDFRTVSGNGIGFIGAGSYAQSNLLPHVRSSSFPLRGVATNSGTTSARVRDKFGFERCVDSAENVIGAHDTNVIFIATRHNTHASYVVEALSQRKHVFVEKPLCINTDELASIQTAVEKAPNQLLMCGFNRRFAPLAVEMKNHFSDAPASMIYRVNAGNVPADHWVHDSSIGGGRLLGEVCHFVDFLTWFTGSLPCLVHATEFGSSQQGSDSWVLSLKFENGSTGTICYLSNGASALGKEYVEIHQSGTTAILNDFCSLEVLRDKRITKRTSLQDKGQAQMVKEFLNRTQQPNGDQLIPFSDLRRVTEICFAALQSISTRQAFGT